MKQIFLLVFFVNAAVSAQTSDSFVKGVDISFIPQIETLGGKYYLDGIPTDPLSIFSQNGVNYIRLRLWHSPASGYCDLASTLEMASRIKQSGLKFLLDFHYSDSWADPANQTKPAAWNNLAFDNLKDSVYTYTKNVIAALKNQNTLPDMVQIGNEIIGGMLWPDGKLYDLPNPDEQLRKFAELIKEGLKAVDDASDSIHIKTVIHIPILDGNIDHVTYFYDRLNTQNVVFDIIGLSYYPWWHGSLLNLKNILNVISNRYNNEIVIAETAYPWTLTWNDNVNNIVGSPSQLHSGYEATVQGQSSFLSDLMQIVKNVPNGKRVGIFYWAPEYISVQPIGSPWENLAMFDFQGNALNSLKAFNDSVTGIDQNDELIISFNLYQNYPNPFNNSTIINYELKEKEEVSFIIYNLMGEVVNVLLNEIKEKGTYSMNWSGKDQYGNDLSSGIYFIKMSTFQFSKSIKAILLK